MSKKSSTSMNLDGLKALAESLKTKPHIEVGVFSAKNARRDTMTNATLAAIHEMGAPEHGLPARSMLRIPISDHAKQIMASVRGHADLLVQSGGPLRFYKLIAIAAEKIVLQAFDTEGFGKWAQLKYSTVLAKLKGSLKKRKAVIGRIYTGESKSGILIASNQLRKSFSSRVRMAYR